MKFSVLSEVFMRLSLITTFLSGVLEKDDVWKADPSEVNAYYHLLHNKFVVTLGFIKAFYHKKAPFFLNYAQIGAVIGHEIVHGFDAHGKSYNKDGEKVVLSLTNRQD